MYFFGDTYFQSFLLKNVFQIILILVIIAELAVLVITTWNHHDGGEKKTIHDRGSMLFIILGFWLAIFMNPICINQFSLILPEYFFWLGIVLTLVGIFTRLYSVWTLRKFFTLSVQVSAKQKIVKEGPYKYVRHPAYTGSILTLFGIAIAFRSPFGIIATVTIIAVIYGYRIKIEEKVLEKKFGLFYEDYEKQTWRLIPYIL